MEVYIDKKINMKIRNYIYLLTLSLLILSCSDENEQIGDNQDNTNNSYVTWTGDLLNFEKSDGADPSLQSNQDRITDNVWITRGNDGGQIFNIVEESLSKSERDNNTSPVGTEWAIGSLDDIGSLNFSNFRPAVGSPKDVVGKNLVLHLIEDDVYLSVRFTSWSSGQKGGFSYSRSTPE